MKNKLLLSVLLIATISSIYGIVSSACSAGMGTKTLVHVPGTLFVDEKVTATVYKCSCNPVDNHLGILLRCQYRSGNDYINDPVGDNVYYVVSGDNVASQTLSICHNNINYAKAKFYGRCGSYPEVCIEREWP